MREKARERGREKTRACESDRRRTYERARARNEGRWAGWGYKQEWTEKQKQRYTTKRPGWSNSTTFFFTNFPENLEHIDMWKVFQQRGRVVEVNIPTKLNREGRRFGFVTYQDVKEAKKLEAILDNIWLGQYKLRVNLPRYAKIGVKEEKQTWHQQNNSKQISKDGKEQVRDGRSFAQIVRGKDRKTEEKVEDPKKGTMMDLDKEKMEKHIMTFKTSGRNEEWLQKSYVGELVDVEDASKFQKKLFEEGIFTVKAIMLGGKKVLLAGVDEEEIEEILNGEAHWFRRWFSKINRWSHDQVSSEKISWMRCYGVPPHAWEVDMFKMIAGRVGSYIKCDEKTVKMKRMDYGRVLVATPIGTKIDGKFRTSINGVGFNITVVEEMMEEEIVENQEGKINDFERYSASGDSASAEEEGDQWQEVHNVKIPEDGLEVEEDVFVKEDLEVQKSTLEKYKSLGNTDTKVADGDVTKGTSLANGTKEVNVGRDKSGTWEESFENAGSIKWDPVLGQNNVVPFWAEEIGTGCRKIGDGPRKQDTKGLETVGHLDSYGATQREEREESLSTNKEEGDYVEDTSNSERDQKRQETESATMLESLEEIVIETPLEASMEEEDRDQQTTKRKQSRERLNGSISSLKEDRNKKYDEGDKESTEDPTLMEIKKEGRGRKRLAKKGVREEKPSRNQNGGGTAAQETQSDTSGEKEVNIQINLDFDDARGVAKKIWDFGKEIGINYSGSEEEVIIRLKEQIQSNAEGGKREIKS